MAVKTYTLPKNLLTDPVGAGEQFYSVCVHAPKLGIALNSAAITVGGVISFTFAAPLTAAQVTHLGLV